MSHEIIYRSLYVQARGALKKELIKHLRTQRTMRHSGHGNRSGEGQGQIKDMISISERPASVEDRALPGHWEGDLIVGSNDSYIGNVGGTSYALCHVGKSGWQRYEERLSTHSSSSRRNYHGNSTGHSPGIAEKNSPITNALAWRQTSMFTFVTRKVRGNEAPTRTLTDS